MLTSRIQRDTLESTGTAAVCATVGCNLRPHGPHLCAACQECHESELLPISSTSGVRWACQNVKQPIWWPDLGPGWLGLVPDGRLRAEFRAALVECAVRFAT